MIQGIEERNYNYFVFKKNSHDLWNGIMLFKGKQDNVYFNVYCKLYGNFLKKCITDMLREKIKITLNKEYSRC